MRKKIILLVVIIIAVIGVWLYLFFTPALKEKPEAITPEKPAPEEILSVAPPVERYEFQGIEYEFISVGGPVYDIITGEITEEQVKQLAEKIIEDILAQEPAAQEITLLFYGDWISAGIGQVDIARIEWTPEGINLKIK